MGRFGNSLERGRLNTKGRFLSRNVGWDMEGISFIGARLTAFTYRALNVRKTAALRAYQNKSALAFLKDDAAQQFG
jgi:hypothetical protein